MMVFKQLTGDEYVSGTFTIFYPGQSFTVTVFFSEYDWPSIQFCRHDGGSPNYYVTGIINPPSVSDLEASVTFQIYDPKR